MAASRGSSTQAACSSLSYIKASGTNPVIADRSVSSGFSSSFSRVNAAAASRQARVTQCFAKWKRICSNPDVLQVVRHGLRFVFADGTPPARRMRQAPAFRGSAAQMRSLAKQIYEWLEEGVIEVSSDPTDFLSLLFPVPKRGTDRYRWVLDSRHLNDYLYRPRFRLEGISDIRCALRQGDWMTSVDLQNAFLQIPIHRRHRRYLAFRALGRQFRFRRMSFGTCVAPYTFTMVMKPVIAELHRRGVRAFIYLDDMLIVGSSFEEARDSLRSAVELLSELGLPINRDKSVLIPTQRIEHLGMVWETEREPKLHVPRPKLKAIAKDARRLLRLDATHGVTARQLAGIGGKITAAAPGMRHAADYRRHAIQRGVHYCLRASHGDWDAPFHLSPSAVTDLRWWASSAPLHFNGTLMRRTFVDRHAAALTTDASPTGWGSVLTLPDGREFKTHGFWTRRESQRSSNWREVTAVVRGFFSFYRRVRSLDRLIIESDNRTAVSVLRRFGSRHRHLGVAMDPLLRAVLRNGIHIEPRYLPGALNAVADRLSRIDPQRNEWSLSWDAFDRIVERFGQPTVDFFASCSNAKVRRFASRLPDPRATFVDAFHQDWSREYGLFVPPINLIWRVVAQLVDQRACGILVVPFWPTQSWSPVLFDCESIMLPSDAMRPAPYAPHPMRNGVAPPLVAYRLDCRDPDEWVNLRRSLSCGRLGRGTGGSLHELWFSDC